MPMLEFKGKPFVYSHHLSVPFRELVLNPKKSLPRGLKASLDDNVIIQGDNLDALKAILPLYAGKVNVIYIDPPYNTGSEGWAYNDRPPVSIPVVPNRPLRNHVAEKQSRKIRVFSFLLGANPDGSHP